MSEFKESKCRFCGRAIVFATNTETGKIVPLYPNPLVYRVWAVGERTECVKDDANDELMVSHFATCTKLPPKKT